MNAVFTRFLKRWLGLPKWTKNAIVHHLCGTRPLEEHLCSRIPKLMAGIEFSGYRPSFLEELPTSKVNLTLPLEYLSYVDRNPIYILPRTFFYRKALARRLLDVSHMDFCDNDSFHSWAEPTCKCKICNKHREPYHSCS